MNSRSRTIRVKMLKWVLAAALIWTFPAAVMADEGNALCVQAFLDFHKLKPGPLDDDLGGKTIRAAELYRANIQTDLPELTSDTVGLWCDYAKSQQEFAALLAFDGIESPPQKPARSKIDRLLYADSFGKYARSPRNIRNQRALDYVPLDNGMTAARIAVNYEDKGHKADWFWNGKPGVQQRFELTEKDSFFMRPNKTYWYRMSVFIPTGTKINDHLTITDFKPQVGKVQMDPILDFKFGLNHLRIQHKFGHPYKCGSFIIKGSQNTLCDETMVFDEIGSVEELSGKWLHFVYRINWARKNQGTLHIWLNDKLVLGLKSDTMLANTRFIRNKFGVYRGYYKFQGTPSPDVSLYFAGIGRAASCEKLALPNCAQLESETGRFEKPGVVNSKTTTHTDLSDR